MIRILLFIFIEIPLFLCFGWISPTTDKREFNYTNPTRFKPMFQAIILLLASVIVHYGIMKLSGYSELTSSYFYFLQDQMFGNFMMNIYLKGFAFWDNYFVFVNPVWNHIWGWISGNELPEALTYVLSFLLFGFIVAGSVYSIVEHFNKQHKFKIFNTIGIAMGIFTSLYIQIMVLTLHADNVACGNEVKGHFYIIFIICMYILQIVPYFLARKYQRIILIADMYRSGIRNKELLKEANNSEVLKNNKRKFIV
ncbi:MAG: hypothetical protein K6E64_09835 [Lachnospiraceae bacterium]|nr:hypothetical protein [Lachnospiraceae bacterium]